MHLWHVVQSRGGWLRAGLIAALLLITPVMAIACPTCKDSVSGDPVADALSWTTLMLMACPSSFVALMGGWIFYTYRRAARTPALPPAPTIGSVTATRP